MILWPLKNLFSNFTGLSLILFYIVHIRDLGCAHKEMALKLKGLRETVNFYKWELKKEDLTEKERDKYLKALKLIDKIIGEKEKSGENKEDYYIENQDKIKKYQRQYYIKNKEKTKEYNKQYRIQRLRW